jgi:tetratricopeptide (TPR) repeat protein
MRLGEALAIGFTGSKHAASASAAWQAAYDLDEEDCHAGALAARSAIKTEAVTLIRELAKRHPECAEAVYLRALVYDPNDPAQGELLVKSVDLKPSSDALVVLAQALAMARKWQQAEQAYSKALHAAPLFPEDWRPDGWAAVHGHLGLAWIHFARGRFKDARDEYTTFMNWFADPGPWHDLTDAEEGWRKKLRARWPEITGVDVN